MIMYIKGFLSKHREVAAYLFFGVLTTAVNYCVYLALLPILTGKTANMTATATALVVSILFAYFTNRKWVFRSAVSGFLPRLCECASFFASRALTGFLDIGIMYLTVDILLLDGRIMKLVSNVVVIILNYILSKLVIFKSKT